MRARSIAAAAAALGLIAGGARAAPVIFTAADPGAGPGMAFPNSAVAAAQFDTAASGTRTLVTFEAAPVGQFTNLVIAPGVTTNGTDSSSTRGNPQQILNAPNPACAGVSILCGFNTTPGGAKYVQLFGGTLTYNFATPISAFGAFFTGVNQTGDTISFNDGSPQTLTIPNSMGGVEFFGFTDTGRQISSITINATVGSFGDLIGMDDVRFFTAAAVSVPEPATLALLATGLANLGLLRRRRWPPTLISPPATRGLPTS
jgi:PEP-CTERM motif